ncbi:MAG TPA: PA14 domain-containing protein [Chitinophagaceae bacterium]|jgi:hypothetical protein|nr:PA14 domain-containing protein [Chitinophagaceae bacterium]HMU56999.1 PA14 domain-containing protein [Chitinophagaceae bacterium]
MLLTLSTHHSKKIAFLFGYLFILSGLCSFVYGRSGTLAQRNVFMHISYPGVSKERVPNFLSGITKPSITGNNNRVEENPSFLKKGVKIPARKKQTDIGGPSQPEMTAFKPVGADNMVDPFTGDFSYNIPLLDVGGYPVNIFYSSGITMDQEASWVGLGWNINPGTIMRNMRGLPDDFDGKEDIIKKTQYVRKDETWGVNAGGRMEIFGGALGIGLDGGIFYNNMRGLGLEAGINPAISIGAKSGDDQTAPLSFGWKLSGNSQTGGSSTFNISLKNRNREALIGEASASIGYHSRQGLSDLHLSAETHLAKVTTNSRYINMAANNLLSPSLGTSISFAYPSFMPAMRGKTSSENYDIDLGFGSAMWGAFGHLRLGGYFSRRWIREEDIVTRQPGYGMLYLKKGQDEKNALMDFNRINDGGYTPGTPAIAVPVYTYDVFTINGEGTGGSFRAYRGDLGYMQDAFLENEGTSGHLGFEIGAGGYGHGAINANVVLTPSSSGGWDKGNLAKQTIRFRESNQDTQAVYFKNPGEKAIPDIAFQEAVGGEDIVRLKMTNTGMGAPTLVPSLVRYTDMLQRKNDLIISSDATIRKRDKRTQVISFLTAAEASRAGLNKRISYIRLNETDTNEVVFGCSNVHRSSFPRFETGETAIRRGHHLSEIDILMPDGRRYIYDIPVYNSKQVQVTFNKKGSGGGNGANEPVTAYTDGTDNVAGNNTQGKDWFVEKQETPPYAHSFLLSGLLSPNYVDVKGDGITEDDMGDAIKFNYSKSEENLRWKTPSGLNKATLNEGLKTDKNDDKANYIYGEREQWYLYSIESKNMVARFYVRNDRKDSRAVYDEKGEINPGFGAFRLEKVSLFTKGELLKRPNNPRPVKTVHFEYDYSLCKDAPGSISGYGKLTLKSIYFTYNGKSRVKKNYYRFKYPEVSDALRNPNYSFTANDRWGNYKANPAVNQLPNADFPYTDQNAANTNEYVKAWTMNQIILPSGASINIDYESDDYAFVQDKRAARMFSVSGFGTSSNPSTYSNKLYDGVSSNYEYIYVEVPRAITVTSQDAVKDQIREWYLSDYTKNRQVYMKLAVYMPTDKNGGGYELIPIYAEITDFGLIPNTNGQKIWLRVKKLESKYTPMVHYSLQFLKSNLPSKAYPGYDVSEEGGLKAVVKSLGALYTSFKEVFNGGMKMFIEDKKCRYTDLSKSFIRLSDPYFKKLGGGIRVKKVVIYDNWNKMTRSNPLANDGMLDATYGQEYFYTKKELVNGELMTVSSGVASWEPSIGADENPHRQAIEYYNKTPKADYDYKVMETPLTEMLYPSAMVGYSRVEVRSIHRDTVKNAPGISVSEFYTTREFPTVSSFTPLSEYNATDLYESGALDKILRTDLKTAVGLSQGFKVDLNDMNGKMKKQSTYSPDNLNDPISYTENFYSMVRTGANSFKLNHNFPVIGGADGKVQQSVIGREIELMTDFRQHKLETITTNINANVDVINGVFIPIPIPTTWKPVVKESNIYRSAAMLKVVNHYSVLDSVVAVDKGSMVSTKNMIYDAETGDALITRTNNEQNQPVYSFSYPAHWAYSGMGLAYKNIDVIFRNVTFRSGKMDANSGVNMNLFESGDEIYVDASKSGWQPVIGTQVCDPASIPATPVSKIWAVNTGKTGSSTPQWVFMDANGNPFTASGVDIRIIRSGKRNMFNMGLGSVISMNYPINPDNGQIELNDSKNIIQTSAASYKDHWRVDNALFKFDTVVQVQQYARVKLKTYTPVDATSIYAKYDSKNRTWITDPIVNLTPGSALSYKEFIHGNAKTEVQMMDSWLQFNINADPLPSGAVLYKAKLRLRSHQENHSQFFPNANQVVGHSRFDPHYNRWGTLNNRDLIPNIITMYRMSSPWPVGTPSQKEGQWKNLFKDANRDLHYWSNPVSVIQEVPIGGGRSNKSYLLTSTADNRLNLPMSSIQNLFADAAAGKTTAIRTLVAREGFGASIIKGNKKGEWSFAQQCFNLSSATGTPPGLQVYYYVCGDTSYQSVTEATPPPNEPADPLVNQLINCQAITSNFYLCRSKFTQRKSMNPYVEGIWGNWRVDTAFVYYGNRKENTVIDGAPVDTRTGGTITGYKSFWNLALASTGLLTRNYSAADVWTYSSTITQYNRKGYEVENKDPLDRYNAGLYGYDQQLPVAVINNSRYVESLFDGFEDYDYQSNSCAETCKPRRRVDMGNIQNYLSGDQKHSGKQSLKVNANQAYSFSAPVVSTGNLNRLYSMRVKMDSTAYTDTTVVSFGTGFNGKYYNYYCGNGWSYPNLDGLTNPIVRNGEIINLQCNSNNKECNGGPNYDCVSGRPPYGINNNFFAARWEGYIQPVVSGKHYFRTLADDGIRVTVNGVTVINRWTEGFAELNSEAAPVTLLKGQVYQIRIDYFEAKQNARAVLLWRHPGMTGYDLVPSRVIYASAAAASGTTSITTSWCTKLDSVNVRGNALTDTFSLVQNRKMLISAWVKVGGNDCKCSTYVNNKIRVTYTGSSTISEFTPSGSIIEGWQRYEGVFEIPGAATNINIQLVNSSTSPAWFDDLRIHPFNANMKSFVYNPQSLRLMSELDENNYASFYEYDDEGTLTRVKKETIKGVKTITETRSHLQSAVQ